MTEELKPCPFCGGHAEADILRPYRNSSTGEREYGLAVYCTGCGVEMMTCPRDVPEAVIEDVIEAWNRRAPSSEAPS